MAYRTMNGRNGLSGDRGVTYLMALMIVVVMGILLGKVGQSWSVSVQREREEELVFRGLQIQRGLQKWHEPVAGQHLATRLSDLGYLIKDPRSSQTVRRLRKLYKDPVSNKDWILIMDPTKGIVGVKPASELTPIKQAGFAEELKDLNGKQKYKDWEFRYRPPLVIVSSTATDNKKTSATATKPVQLLRRP